MSDLLEFGSHPDADQLNAFVEHALPAHEKQQTLEHLAVCPDCRTIVALALPSAQEPSQTDAVRRSWFRGWNVAWIGLPALAAIAVLAIFLPKIRNDKILNRASGETKRDQVAVARAPAPTRSFDLSSASPLNAPKTQHAMGAFGTGGYRPASLRAVPISGRNTVSCASLPSHLAVLSIAASGRKQLAIDTANTLFFSTDEGRHWRAVPPQWLGHAVRVSLLVESTIAESAAAAISLPQQAEVVTGAVRAQGAEIAGPGLTGAITDASGAVIPNADVVVSDTGNALVHSAKTDPEGHFVIDNLAPGTYKVEAVAPGFTKRSVVVEIAASQPPSVNLSLEIGASSQTVEVTAAAPSISPTPPIAVDESPVTFEITTDTGDHWITTDGLTWTHK
jgi:hypothetical protein